MLFALIRTHDMHHDAIHCQAECRLMVQPSTCWAAEADRKVLKHVR